MSGILRLESLTKGNTLKQGDKTPLKYRLFDADGEKLNIAGKSAQVRLVYPDFLTIGYEKDGLTVAQDDTVTFTIDSIIPSRIYHVEIIVDGNFIFPSRADEAKFTVDKSSLGTESNIIEIVGVDQIVNTVLGRVDADISQVVTDITTTNEAIQQAEQERVQGYQEIQQIIEDGVLTAEPADGSLTNKKYADKSVSQKKMNLPFGYLPIELEYFATLVSRTRAHSERIVLPEDTNIYVHDSDYKVSVRYYDSDDNRTVTQWFEKEMIVSLLNNNSVSLEIYVGKVNDSAMSNSEINNLRNIIEIVTPETAVKHSQLDDKLLPITEGDPYAYALEHGSINGNTGANAHSGNTRVRPIGMLNVPKNSIIELTDSDNYIMALYAESINFFVDGWNTTRYNVTQNDSFRWMVERKDKAVIPLVDASKLVKVITPKTLLRREDLGGSDSGTGATIVSNETEFFSAIQPNTTIDIANSFKITKKVSINVNLKINGNGHTIDGAGVTGILITVSDGVVVFDNLEVINGDTNIIKTTGGEVTIIDSKMLHSNNSITYLGGTSVVKLIRSEFAYSKGNDGIAPKESAKVYIYDCLAHDNFDEGISTHDSSYTEVYGGNYYNNGYVVGTAETTKTTGASSSFGGIHIGGGLMGVVKNANVYNNRTYGISLINFMDMTLDDKEIVTGNTVYDNGGFGIFCTASRGLMMSDNLIIRNGKGIGFGKEPSYAPEIASMGYVTNNTIIDNDGVAIQVHVDDAELYDVLFIGNTIAKNGDDSINVPSNFGGEII